jgi:hypothetical protein
VTRGRLTQPYFSRAGLYPAEQGPHALALRDSGGAFLGRVLGAFEGLPQANLMLRGVAIDEDGKLGNRTQARRTHIVFTQVCDGNRGTPFGVA